MNAEFFREYCLNKRGVTEGFPFDSKTLVYKVGDKMFALTDVDEFISINLKCEPAMSVDLRERYEGVRPGWHMNKKHWNTVAVNSDVPITLLQELIDHSYHLVFDSLPKRIKNELQNR
jgi:predicted DNA-binding protein (MmcQ/YjbR family)